MNFVLVYEIVQVFAIIACVVLLAVAVVKETRNTDVGPIDVAHEHPLTYDKNTHTYS